MKQSQRIFLSFIVISSLLLIFVALKNPQSLYSDSAWQMKALQQFIAGESPSFNHLVRPSYDDLAVNKAIWITWWPPGTNLLAYPLMAQGIPVGTSIRIIAIASFILGSLGWICWFSLFDFPIWMGIILALTIPSLRYGNSALYTYSAEVLVYAYAPWLILVTYQFSKYLHNETTFIKNIVKYLIISPIIGLIFAFGYIIKYSLLFVVLGALIYLGFQCITHNNSRQQTISKLTAYVLVCLSCAIPLLALNLVNQNLGQTANLITATAKIISLKWQNFIYVIANPALAMTDAELLGKMILNAQYSIAPSSLWIGLIGLPGGILLLWLILRDRATPQASLLAKIIFFTSMAAIFGIWSVGATVSYEARHVVSASLAILPVALQSASELWHKKSNSFLIKGFLCIAALFYLAIPLAYSSTSIIAKALKTSAHYTPASSQIYNPWLASQDLARVRTELVKDFNEQTDIWYLPEPITALDLPGRAIITSADFYGGLEDKILRNQTFRSSTPLRVHVLLPRSFEDNGKGLLIRSFFVQGHEWICQEIEGSNYVKWTSTLEVL